MRTLALALTIVATLASPALAALPKSPSGPPKISATVRVVNKSNTEVQVTVNGTLSLLIEDGSFADFGILNPTNNQTIMVTASVPNVPSATVSASGAVQKGKITTATITGDESQLSIAMSLPGQSANLLTRDTGVALASVGGLLPLLWLGALLGGKPRTRRICTSAQV